MSISAEEKKRYFQETAIVLQREGFRVEPSVGGRLGVWLDDHPICEVDQIGGITYRSDNIPTPEYVAAKDKASLTARFGEDGKCKTYNPNHGPSFDGQYIILSIKWEQFALNRVNYRRSFALITA